MYIIHVPSLTFVITQSVDYKFSKLRKKEHLTKCGASGTATSSHTLIFSLIEFNVSRIITKRQNVENFDTKKSAIAQASATDVTS